MFSVALLLVSFLVAVSACPVAALAQSAGSTPRLFVEYQPPAKSYALIIGNDSYPGAELQRARSDARRVGEALKSVHKFDDVDVALDLDSEKLRKRIRDFLDFKGRSADARLFLWFAGHGTFIDIRGEQHQFLLPVDAPTTTTEETKAEIINKGIDLTWLRQHIQRFVETRHVMVVLDSCYSGGIARARLRGENRLPPPSPPARWNNSVRQFIASGSARQEVYDNGVFAKVFVEAISGQSPSLKTAHPGYLTGTELSNHLYDYFNANFRDDQRPVWLPVARSRDEQSGEFVFGLKPRENAGRWRIFLPGAEPKNALTADQPELANLAERCAIGKRHQTPIKAAQEILFQIDPRRFSVRHSYNEGQTHPATGQPINASPTPAHSIERDRELIRVRYGDNGDNGEMILIPIHDESLASPDDTGGFLLQGAWSRDGGTGCAEFRINMRTREGHGQIWLGMRNRFGVQVPGVTKAPLKSTLKIVPQ